MIFRSLKLSMLGAALLAVFVLPVAIIQPAYAQVDEEAKQAACDGIGAVGGNCDDGSAGGSIDQIIKTVVEVLSWIVGVAAVIMLIIGGFRYVTSGGDSNATAAAKNTILYALIGFVIALMAQALVRFVFIEATTTPDSDVNLCDPRTGDNPDPSRPCAI